MSEITDNEKPQIPYKRKDEPREIKGGEKYEITYVKWLKEVEGKKFFRIFGFGIRPIAWIYLGVIVVIFIAIGILYGIYWFGVAFGFNLGVVGIGFLLQSSWCLRKSWELNYKARKEDNEKNREMIQVATAICKDYVEVCRNWGAACLAIAAGIIALIELLLAR